MASPQKGFSMDINHISVSRKKCFDTCTQQYKYRYHLKLPRPGEEPIYFVYGTIVHKISELYVQNRGEIPIGDIAKDLLRGKIELEDGLKCPPLPEEYTKKLQKHLRSIQNLTDRIGTGGITEWEFRYDLDPPHGRHVTGFIDRLIVKDDKAFIIDYKTTKKGKWRVDKTTVKDDLQLRCYSRVVQREFGIPAENIKAALFYLDGENLIACQYSDESLLQVERELKEAFIQIEKSDPDKVWGKVGWHCKNCDYATICPFYSPQTAEQASWSGELVDLGHAHDPWADED
jgi:RecB family exonuclease